MKTLINEHRSNSIKKSRLKILITLILFSLVILFVNNSNADEIIQQPSTNNTIQIQDENEPSEEVQVEDEDQEETSDEISSSDTL